MAGGGLTDYPTRDSTDIVDLDQIWSNDADVIVGKVSGSWHLFRRKESLSLNLLVSILSNILGALLDFLVECFKIND